MIVLKCTIYLKNSGLVESIDINAYGKVLLDPNDPLYSSQWHLNHPNYADINAPEGWEIISLFDGSFGAGVIIAVIDQGTYRDHVDLRFWPNWGWDYIEGDNQPQHTGGSHGTHVSGIAAARTNNGIGVAGVAGGWGEPFEGAQIMSLKVIAGGQLNSDAVDDAIIYAVLNGAKIINMSFASPDLSAIRAAIDFAYNQRGCLLIAAGGNYSNETQPVFPARDPYVMAVAGIKLNWTRYGNQGNDLEISALAEVIRSTLDNGSYGDFSGTSQSAPQVSGAAALLWSNIPDLTSFDIRRILKATADKNFATYNPFFFGEGLLKIDNALNYISNLPAKPSNITISAPIGGHPIISWSGVPGADSYNVYRSTPNHRLDLFKVTSTVNNSWTDNSITVSNSKTAPLYYYRVTTVDGNYESAVSNEVMCGSIDAGKLSTSHSEDILTDNKLFNNYPNPFNSSTKIKFSLKKEMPVKIAIYNILGELISELINEVKPQGVHEVIFDESSLPSGLYLYRITTQDYTATKKMIILK